MNPRLKIPLIALFLLGVGFLYLQSEQPELFQNSLERTALDSTYGHSGANDHSEGGEHFSGEDMDVEVTIFEAGIRPEFRVSVKDRQGNPLPQSEIDLKIKLTRLGGHTDSFTFVSSDGMYVSREPVEEPHSFDALIKVTWKGTTHEWTYSQVEARAEISEEMSGLSNIKVAKAGPVTLKTVLSLNGEIGLDEKRTAHVVPRLNAVVKKVVRHLGDSVQKGEVIALLDSRDLADARNSHVKAMKNLEPILLDLEREELLYKNTLSLLELLKKDTDLDALATSIDSMTLGESRAQLIPAFAKMKQTLSVVEREKKLFYKKISPESDYRLAQEQYQTAKANYHALREKIWYQNKLSLMQKQKATEKAELDIQTSEQKLLALGLTPNEIDDLSISEEQSSTRYALRAPLTGEIIQKHLAVGEALGPNDDILVVADLSELWVHLAIPVTDLDSVKVGQKATITEGNQNLKATGVLSYLGSVIDQTTRTVTGRVVIPNSKNTWRPGMYVRVELVKEESRVGIAVPVDATQKYRGWDVVFVKYGTTYEARPVTLGITDGAWVEIKQGLRLHEPYVSKNSFTVKAEIGKSAATHSH